MSALSNLSSSKDAEGIDISWTNRKSLKCITKCLNTYMTYQQARKVRTDIDLHSL